MLSILLMALPLLSVSCGKDGKSPDPITCMEDLRGKEVGVVMGSLGDFEMTGAGCGAIVRRYGTPALLMQAMQMDKLDAAFADEIMTMDPHFAEKGMEVKFRGQSFGNACFGFSYSNPELCDAFNAFLAKAKEDGTYDEVLSRWTVENADKVRMPDIPVAEDGESLHVGILGGDVPFAFVNARGFSGIEPELLERFAYSIGRRVFYHEYEVGALFASLQTGKIDIISAFLFKTEEREKSILFSEPYYACPMVCFAKTAGAAAKTGYFGRIKNGFYNNIIAEERYDLILEGLEATLLIAILSILFGTVLGAFMCWRLLVGKKEIWHGILKVYGAVMHGVPLLVILMLMFYVVFSSSSISAVAVSIVTFSIYFGYASCEIFHTGITGVAKGQVEAARSLGMSRFKAFRYVVFPQAVRSIVPFYESEAVTLLKETCLVGFIAVVDLTKATDIIQSRTFDAFFPLITAAVIYFVLAWLLGLALGRITKKRPEK